MTTATELNKKSENTAHRPESQPRDPFFIGVEEALHHAAKRARKRAIALNGYVATWRDGKIVYDTEP